MIERISRRVTFWLLENKAISVEYFDLYNYAVQVFVYLFIPYIMVAIMTPFVGLSYEGFMLVTSYTLLRRECGGFHFKSAKVCLIVSSITLFTIISIGKVLSEDKLILFPTFLCILSIMFFSPLKQKEFEKDLVLRKKKKISVIIALLLSINLLLDIILKTYQSRWICLGIILTALLQYPRILAEER